MLVCSISQRARRAAIAADVAEVVTALDTNTIGNIIFATLVDDPASVGEIVDAYLGEIMLETASAADTVLASIPALIAADLAETTTAADTSDAGTSILPPPGVTGLIGWWDASVTASLTLSGTDILSVADQSGGGNTMNWISAKPQYNATGFNSIKPAIMLVPGNTCLQASAFPMGAGNNMTAWAVCSLGATGTPGHCRMLSYRAPGFNDFNSNASWFFGGLSPTVLELYSNGNITSSSATTPDPALHRFIVTVNAGAITLYIDGVSVGTGSKTGNWATGGLLAIGLNTGTNDGPIYTSLGECGVATGYSDSTAVGQLDTYLKTKWPGDPSWTSVKLLMGFNGTNGATGAPGMADESSAAHGTASVSGATISTAQSVFGGSSLLCNGSGWITFPTSTDWNFSNQPFTVEFRMYPTGINFGFVVGQWDSPSLGWILYQNNATMTLNLSTTGSDNINHMSGGTIVANTWHAIALDFDGTKYRLYVNGVMAGSSTTVRTIANSTQLLSVGASAGGNFKFQGYVDELRLTKGVARYASDSGYTVATSAFPRS